MKLTMGDPPRGTLTTPADRLRHRFRPSASAASIESVVNPISSPFARACRRRTSSSLCLDPSRQRSLLRLSLGPTSHQPSSVPGITPWSEPGFHLGLVGHRFVRSLEGAYPCYRISGFRRDHALERMLPLDPFRQGGLRTPRAVASPRHDSGLSSLTDLGLALPCTSPVTSISPRRSPRSAEQSSASQDWDVSPLAGAHRSAPEAGRGRCVE
jgi:hypothetical protein